MQDESPIQPHQIIGAMLRGEFRPMTDSDLEGFAGVEYDGWIAEIEGYLVVVDHCPGEGCIVSVTDSDNLLEWDYEMNFKAIG